MPVFISHKSSDKDQALIIARYLEQRRVRVYIDIFDPALKNTNDITSVIVDRVRTCTHIIAVTSMETTKSWWVPFEIGVATDQDRRITTYALQPSDLPDYLKKWPIMTHQRDLEEFVNLYKRDKTVALEEATTLDGYNYSTRNIVTAESFHSSLKRQLGQI